ncbi:MAG: hypothetical protein SOY27_01415 [Fournierella sp.]|uniref:hypothetical protein n=1 Tax=Allofournierella sp. TaxID=1940256 RepID=UPI002A840AEC|nr:hypothetical protein [Fournierella sp.]MDY4166133.1 hypothetical protein [Fournierella sp.]
MDLKNLLMRQPCSTLQYKEARQAAEICYSHIKQGNPFFALDLAIGYGIMLGKHLARGGEGGVCNE